MYGDMPTSLWHLQFCAKKLAHCINYQSSCQPFPSLHWNVLPKCLSSKTLTLLNQSVIMHFSSWVWPHFFHGGWLQTITPSFPLNVSQHCSAQWLADSSIHPLPVEGPSFYFFQGECKQTKKLHHTFNLSWLEENDITYLVEETLHWLHANWRMFDDW